MELLTFDELKAAVIDGTAITAKVQLQPAGGTGDKVFPATYSNGDAPAYAYERRRVEDALVDTVLLDSVASQANRLEHALEVALARQEIAMPQAYVDFTAAEGLQDIGRVTSLQTSHRMYDAAFRDSSRDSTPFLQTAVGQAISAATPCNATAIYQYCPQIALLGGWNSTGAQGGSGAKFQRCLVSEIVAMDVQEGKKTSSRIDRLSIQKCEIFQHRDDPNGWTIEEKEAARTPKNVPVKFSRKGRDKSGTPATINHGNIKPTISADGGGITMRYAVQTSVLSLVALRRLQFRHNCQGEVLSPSEAGAAALAAQIVLASLGLVAIVHAREQGYDLRSRCLLIPEGPLQMELLGSHSQERRAFTLTPKQAADLLEQAVKYARDLNMEWQVTPLALKPNPNLVALMRKSRQLADAEEIAP